MTQPDPQTDGPAPSRRGVWLLLAWSVAFAVALVADAPVARWARASGTAVSVRNSRWAEWVKVPGSFWFTAAVVAVLWACRRVDWRRVLFVAAVAAYAGLNGLLKWAVGRTRPFKLPSSVGGQPRPLYLQPFWHGLRGLFDQHDLSFPSGHACTAFALAAGVGVAWRPGAWPLLVLATAVGVERVLENAHYCSDVIGAVGFVAVGLLLARAVMAPWLVRADRRGFPVIVPAADRL